LAHTGLISDNTGVLCGNSFGPGWTHLSSCRHGRLVRGYDCDPISSCRHGRLVRGCDPIYSQVVFWSCELDSNRKFNLCSPICSCLCVYSREFGCSLNKDFLSHLLILLSGFYSPSKLGFEQKPITNLGYRRTAVSWATGIRTNDVVKLTFAEMC
jgi:hypothetical protein